MDDLKNLAISRAVEKNYILQWAMEWAQIESGQRPSWYRWIDEIRDEVFSEPVGPGFYWWWLRLKLLRIVTMFVAPLMGILAFFVLPFTSAHLYEQAFNQNGYSWALLLGTFSAWGIIYWRVGTFAKSRWQLECAVFKRGPFPGPPATSRLSWEKVVGILRVEVDPREAKADVEEQKMLRRELGYEFRPYSDAWYQPLVRRKRDTMARLIPFVN